MSQEWKEPNSTWQYPHPNADRWEDELEDLPPLSYPQDDEEAALAGPSPFPSEDFADDDASPVTAFFGRFEGLLQLGQQLSPVLIPLLFGGLTFLFILPLARTGHSYLRVAQVWPVVLVLIAVAVLQGMMLYYASSNNVYWSLSIVAGFLLFLLVGCFAVFGPLSTGILFIVLLITAIIAIRFCMRIVPEGTVDLIYSFGKYNRTFFPGLNFLLPWEEVNTHLQTRERQWICPEQTVQVSRDEDVHLKASVSYQLIPEDAYLAITRVEDWEKSLQESFLELLQGTGNKLTPDDFIAWPERSRLLQSTSGKLFVSEAESEAEEQSHWERFNTYLFQRLRDRVALWGVLINWVHIRDITLTPRGISSSTNFIANVPAIQPQEAALPPEAQTTILQKEKAGTRPGLDTSAKLKSMPPSAATQVQPQPKASPEPVPVGQGQKPNVKPMEAAAAPLTPATKKEEALIKAYKQVQGGKITDAETIRNIASRFQRIADDPEQSKTVSFDAARAAETLYQRADLIEEQMGVERGSMYDDDETPIPSGWNYRRPTDDNLMAGG